MKYSDVFVPGGFPLHTYNPREEKKLEERIEEARNNLCKLITITGQTKSGKTVLTKKIYPKRSNIWINGGSIKIEDDFWNILIDQLEYYQTESLSIGEEISSASSNEDMIKGELGVIGGTKKYTATTGDKSANISIKTKSISTKISALKALEEIKTPIVIDDFHYIERAI